jgi:hypothetical protein
VVEGLRSTGSSSGWAQGRARGRAVVEPRAVDRLAKRFPNAIMIHTPAHASRVNRAEIYFSVVQPVLPDPPQQVTCRRM